MKSQPLLRGSWSSSWWISLILHCGGCTWATRQVALTRELFLWQKCHLFPRLGYSAGIWLGPVSHPLSSRENDRERHVLLAHYLNGRRATQVLLSDRESQPLLFPAVFHDNCVLICSGSFILQDLWLFRDSYEEQKYYRGQSCWTKNENACGNLMKYF